MEGGTTGGGVDLKNAVIVDNMKDLQNKIRGNESKIVLVKPGNYNGEIVPNRNTTIIGLGPGVNIVGTIQVVDTSNVIIRNLTIRGKKCVINSIGECDGGDAVYIGDGAHHVWIDHVDISDGPDGNLDITKKGDFITISWCKFYYTWDKPHRLSNLISASDNSGGDSGKLNITYMFCMWGDLVKERQPRGRFGKIHMLNNYHNNDGRIHGVGKEMAIIAENSYYDTRSDKDIFFTKGGEHKGWKGIGNKGTGKNLNVSTGTVFTIPYKYPKVSASDAKKMITSKYGVGNTRFLTM